MIFEISENFIYTSIWDIDCKLYMPEILIDFLNMPIPQNNEELLKFIESKKKLIHLKEDPDSFFELMKNDKDYIFHILDEFIIYYLDIVLTGFDTEEKVKIINNIKNEAIHLTNSLIIKKPSLEYWPIDDITLKVNIYIEFMDGCLTESYEIDFINIFMRLLIAKIYGAKEIILRCENCQKFFIPQSRSDEKYCNFVNEDGKTCKEIGYGNKIKTNDITKEYRRAYKNLNGKKNRYMKKYTNFSDDIINRYNESAIRLNEIKYMVEEEKISYDRYLELVKEIEEGYSVNYRKKR